MNFRTISFALTILITTVIAVPAVFAARMSGDKPDPPAGDNLSLRLVGTALAEYPADSIAVIESGSDGRQRSYREGDLVDGVRIKQILRNRVIVQTDSGEKAITMSRSQFSAAESTVIQERSSAPIAFGPRPPESRMHDTRYLDQESVESELANIESIVRTASIETVSVYGKPVGVRIAPIEPESIFSKIGLKTGDIIQEVNGVQVARPEEAIAIFRRLKTGDDIDIKVKGRRTRQIHLIFE